MAASVCPFASACRFSANARAASALFAFFSAYEILGFDVDSGVGVDVPLAVGVPALDGVLDGDFALESIVIVTGPYHDSTSSEAMKASYGFRFTSLQSETCIIAPNFPSGNVVQVSWR